MTSSFMFRASLMFFAVTILIKSTFSAPSDGNLTIGLILPYKVGSPDVPPGNRYASALKIAVDRINRDPTLLPGITLSFTWDDSECLEELSIQALIEQWEKRVDGFIGFGCGCSTQARIAAALNLPVISHVSTSTQCTVM